MADLPFQEATVKNRIAFIRLLVGGALLLVLSVTKDASASGPTLSASVTDGNPSVLNFSGSGYTKGGSVWVGTWDSTLGEYTAGEYVTASSGFFGGLIYGSFNMDCSDNDTQYAYGYDETTFTLSNGVQVRSNCTDGPR